MKKSDVVSTGTRAGLLLAGFGLLSAPLRQAMAVDGTWLGSTSNVTPGADYTNTINWAGGIVASGADATASFIYNPVSDAGGAGPAGGLILNTDITLGNIVFNDTDGWGSSTIGWNQATAGTPRNLTLDTTAGTAPVITSGLLLNSQSGGKKVVINHNLLGNDGLTVNGPGFLGLRGSLGTTAATTSTLSGALTVENGVLQLQSQLASITAVTVRGGGQLFLDFSTSGGSGTDRISPAATLTLGGAGGSGTVTNSNASATANHSQTFAGVTLNAGANQIVANTAANQNMTYNLGTVVSNGRSALNLVKNGAGTGGLNLSNANVNGIIGGWATYNGGDFATSNAGIAAAYTAYTANTWAAGSNTNVAGDQVLAAGAVTDTLRFNNGTAFRLKLGGTATVQTGGIISAQQSPLIEGGTLTSGTTDLITHVNGGILRVSSRIADGAAGPVTLVKSLGGTLQIEGANTYTGGTVVGGGNVIVGLGPLGGAAGDLGSGPVILSNSNTNTGLTAISGTLIFNRSGTYTPANSINAAVNGGGYLAQAAGGGTLILNQGMKIGGFVQQAGTTRLDFAAATAPASQIIDGSFSTGPSVIHTARLVARNGTLELAGRAGAASVQDFALTEVLGSVDLALTAGAGGSTTLNLGALSRPSNNTDGGGTLALGMGSGTAVTTPYGTAGAVIAENGTPFVTVNGNDWGAKDAGNTQIVGGSTLAGFYTATTGAGLTGGTNVDVTMNDSVTGTIQTGSLRFDTAAAGTLTVNAGGTLRPGGILVTPGVGANVTAIGGAGDIRSNTGQRDITLFQNNPRGSLVIAVPVVNFDGSNASHIVKTGAGEVAMSAASTYTGRTMVNEGTLRLTGTGAIGSSAARTGNIFVRGGEFVVGDDAKVFTGQYASFGQRQGENGTLTVEGRGVFDISADFNIGDVNARGVLNLRDSGSVVTKTLFVGKAGYSEGVVNQTGGTLMAGNTPAGDWMLGGVNAGDTGAKGTYNISGGSLQTGGQNFQTGRWGTGELNITGSGSVSGTGWNVIGRFNTGAGTVNIRDNGTYDVSAGQNFLIVGEQGTGILNIGGGAGTATLKAKNLSLAHNGGNGTVNQTGGLVDLTATTAPSGTINAGVVFGGTNAPGVTVTDYAGTYNLSGGMLRTFGVRENTGITLPVNSTFNFNGGTVQATGSNPVFMDNLDLAAVQTGGAKLDTSVFSITVAQNLVHDAALGATADGGLTKSGTGVLTLTGANTYTGPTRVTAGTLLINGSQLAAAGLVTVSSGATLGGAGSFGGGLDVQGGATLAPGNSAGTLTAGGSADFASTSVLNYEFLGSDTTVGGANNDLLAGVTMLTLDGTLNVTETAAGSFLSAGLGDAWRIISYTGALTDNGLALGSMPALSPGLAFAVDTATTGQVNLMVVPVPEPGVTASLLGSIFAFLGRRRPRRTGAVC